MPSVQDILTKDGEVFGLAMPIIAVNRLSRLARVRQLLTPMALLLGNEAASDMAGIVGNQVATVASLQNSPTHRFYYTSLADPPQVVVPGVEPSGQGFELDFVNVTVHPRIRVSTTIGTDDLKMFPDPIQVVNSRIDEHLGSILTTTETRIAAALVNAGRSPSIIKNGRVLRGAGIRHVVNANSIADAFPATAAGGAALNLALEQLILDFDEANSSRDGQVLIMRPREFVSVGTREAANFNRDTSPPESVGDLARLQLRYISDFLAVKAPNIMPDRVVGPSDPIMGSGLPDVYQGDFTVTGAGQPVAIGLKMDPLRKPLYIIRDDPTPMFVFERRETKHAIYMESSMLMGTGIVYPQSVALLEVKAAA